MYELKKFGKVFTNKFVGTGPSSYKENNLPGRGLTKVEKHWSSHYTDRATPALFLSPVPIRLCSSVLETELRIWTGLSLIETKQKLIVGGRDKRVN